MRMVQIRGSSFVKGAGFTGLAGDNATLRIKFDDATIDFFRVPYLVFKALIRSRDPAHYYLRNIYGMYSYSKVL
jgi:hypothetical protein